MPIFMVERNVKSLEPQALAATQAAVIAKASELSSAGRAIRFIRTTVLPRDGRCITFFECSDPVTLWRLHEEVGVPVDGATELPDPTSPARSGPCRLWDDR